MLNLASVPIDKPEIPSPIKSEMFAFEEMKETEGEIDNSFNMSPTVKSDNLKDDDSILKRSELGVHDNKTASKMQRGPNEFELNEFIITETTPLKIPA